MSDNLVTKTLEVKVVISDGSPIRKDLALTQEAMQKLREEQQKLRKDEKTIRDDRDQYKKNTQEWRDYQEELVLVRSKLDDVGKAILDNDAQQAKFKEALGLTGLSMGELRQKAIALRKDLGTNAANLGTPEYTALEAELLEVQTRIDSLGKTAAREMRVWELVRDQYKLTELNTEQLAVETKRLQAIIANPATDSATRAKTAQELALVTDRTQQLTNANRISADAWALQRQGMKLTDLSMEQLGLEATRLKLKLDTMAPTDPGLGRTRSELLQVQERAKALESGLGPLGRAWGAVKGQIMGAVAVLGTFFAGNFLLSGFQNLVSGAAKVSDQLADVQKVTGLTAVQVKDLNSEIAKIDTRTATSELRGIAIGLGQVNEAVTKESVSAINKINLALGTEFGANAQEITNTISVLRNNLSDLKSGDYAKDVGEIGNAILVLGQAGLATAPVVSDIATRISGVARQFGISSGAILGTSAAMQELGISTERGSTAYVRILSKIAQVPQVFADLVKQAGGDSKNFIHLVNTDMNAAFLEVAIAARIAGKDNTAFGAILEDLKAKGVGVSELLSKFGANTDLLTEKIKVATEALKSQDAINKQAALSEKNLAGEVENLGKAWTNITTSRTVLDWLTGLVVGLRNALEWIKRNSDTIVFWAKVIGQAAVAWVSYRVAIAATSLATRIATAAQAAYGTVVGVVTGEIEVATVATRAFNTVTKLNPIGLVISLITTAISIFATFGDEVVKAKDDLTEFNKEQQKTIDRARELNQVMNKSGKDLRNESTSDVQDALAAVRAEAEALSKTTFDVQGALANARFKLPKLESEARPAGLAPGIPFLDQGQLNASTERGKRNIATVFEAYKKFLQSEQDRLQKELRDRTEATTPDPTDGEGGASDAEKKAKENLDALLAQYRLFQEDLANDKSTADEKALAELDRKQREELLKVQDQQKKLIAAKQLSPEQAKTDIGLLQDRQKQEKEQLEKDQAKRRFDLLKETNDKVQTLLGAGRNADLQTDVKYYADALEEAKRGNGNLLDAENNYKDAQLRLYKKNALDLIDQEVKKYQDLIVLAKKNLQDFDDATTKSGVTPDDKTLAERRKLVQGIEDLEKGKAAAVKEINKQLAVDLKKIDDQATEEARAALVKKYQNYAEYASAFGKVIDGIGQYIGASEQIAEQRADADGVRTQSEIDNINRLKEQQRTAALVAIATQGAIAIATGVAQAIAAGPFPANLLAIATTVGTVLGLIAQARTLLASGGASSSGGSSAAQSALASAPQGAQGMAIGSDGQITMAGGGVLQGPSHAEGGLTVLDPKTGKPVAELEGGELMLVLSRAATAANADLIPAMLKASKAGKRLNFFAPPPQVNMQSAQQAMRVVHMAEGGAIGASAALAHHGSAANAAKLEALMGRAVELLGSAVTLQKQATEAIQRIPTNLKATVALNPSYDRELKKWDTLKETYNKKAG